MICPNCKEEIDDDSIFCNYCSIKIKQDSENLKREEDITKIDNDAGCCNICGTKIKIPHSISKLVSKLSIGLFYIILVLLLISLLIGVFGIGRPKYKYSGFKGPDGYCDYCGKKLTFIDMLFQTTKRGYEFCRQHRWYDKYQAIDGKSRSQSNLPETQK